MLFTTSECDDGWLKTVVSPAPILKLCQLSTARFPVVMVSCEPLACVVAAPEATVMPVGLAMAFRAMPIAKKTVMCRDALISNFMSIACSVALQIGDKFCT